MNQALRGALALVGAAALGSVMGVFSRALSGSLEVIEQVALRCALGAAILLPLMLRPAARRRLGQVERGDLWRIALSSVSIYVVAISLNTFAYINGKYGSAATVMAMPFPAIAGFLLFGERFNMRQIASIALASLGASLVIGTSFTLSRADGLAMVAAFGAGFFMSAGILGQRSISQTLSIVEKTFLMLAVAAVVLTGASLVRSGGASGFSGLDWHAAWIGLVAGAANVLFLFGTNYGVGRVHAAMVNNALALQTVFAAIVAYLVYASRFTSAEYLGAGLIIASILLQRRRSPQPG
ncbi:MAG TPA: DMT family transporter [Amaricoccus sp.]|uniref:DMT family transporter n=1 Tax=Amaricoccus sp. TaxID=1872485 RepID=UPI002D0C311F|nr:DMT family transporter [Amaricoccus sp.]HMQ92030.1 DMT family transporter [Amaricoccus sp.]HMR53726.1 DMT family transporter [Amaricoccus sp.]HMU00769.1 DMT family transporter [Amaricoccus sp.]